jgi:predicted lipoprotein with Yx(FWY)xxD motif
MKRWLALAVVALMVTATLGARMHTSAQGTTTVMVSETPELGKFLTDSEGRTLYLFTKDTEAGVSTCGGDCATNWPPYTPAEPLTLPDGVDGALSLVDTPDGVKTLAYNDIPLYYFAGDTEPGQTNGEGKGEVWYVVAPGELFGARAAEEAEEHAAEGSPMASPVASPAAMGATTVVVKSDPTLGDFFTDSEGRTLYLFTKDTEMGVSTCGGDCATNWPAYTATEPLTLPDGVDGELTLVDTPDGVKTVAYNGIPLYYFAGDTEAGQTNGEGVGGVWWVVAPGAQFGEATEVAS